MKSNATKDERVITQARKFQSEALQILVVCLLVSVLVQQFFLQASFSQYAVEFFCAIGACIYVKIRNLSSGIDTEGATKKSNKKILITGLVSGAVFMFLYIVLTGENSLATAAVVSLSYFAVFFIVSFVMKGVTQKRLKQIDDKLNRDELEEINE